MPIFGIYSGRMWLPLEVSELQNDPIKGKGGRISHKHPHTSITNLGVAGPSLGYWISKLAPGAPYQFSIGCSWVSQLSSLRVCMQCVQ